MMREFVGFGAYEAACKLDEGLQGWKPVVVGLQFDLSDSEVFRAVQDGVLDICRIIHNDCSIQLLIRYLVSGLLVALCCDACSSITELGIAHA